MDLELEMHRLTYRSFLWDQFLLKIEVMVVGATHCSPSPHLFFFFF